MATRRNKIGRNEPCPCGSGRKFKRCHGSVDAEPSPLNDPAVWATIDQLRKEAEAREHQRRQQQGYGRPVISWLHDGTRFITVGTTFLWSKQWVTFHDFLKAYPNHVFGQDWLQSETLKPQKNRHPFATTRKLAMDDAAKLAKKHGRVFSIPQTSAGNAFLRLAYNLYLTAHNASLQEWLIKRLKHSYQYWGALYEAHVAAFFIQAGFDIEFEDEADSSSSHCEFVAVSPVTGNKYSVEAKCRNRRDTNTAANNNSSMREYLSVGRQLKKALKKSTQHQRVVFIEVSVPEMDSEIAANQIANTALKDLREREKTLFINGAPAPSAYVFVTNYPYFQQHDGSQSAHMIFTTGFKIPDFGPDKPFTNAHDYLRAKER